MSWHAGVIALGAIVVTGIFRLLIEWQRRLTLLALMRDAPPRAVVLRDDKDAGSSTRVWMGDGVMPSSPGARSETSP